MQAQYCRLFFLLLGAWAGNAIAQSDEEDLALIYGDKATISLATGSQQPR